MAETSRLNDAVIGTVPLMGRGAVEGTWSDFEGALFNLITRHRPGGNMRFSHRLPMTQAALDAIRDQIAAFDVEHWPGADRVITR